MLLHGNPPTVLPEGGYGLMDGEEVAGMLLSSLGNAELVLRMEGSPTAYFDLKPAHGNLGKFATECLAWTRELDDA